MKKTFKLFIRTILNNMIFVLSVMLDGISFDHRLGIGNIKNLILKMNGMKIGKNCFFDSGFRFLHAKNITIGNNCSFGHYNKLWAFSPIIIGDNVQTALGLIIVSGTHKLDSYAPITEGQQVILEGENWIGANVTIISGVTIGIGAVIAAGAVVTKNIPPYTVAGGVPAKVIKERIPSQKVETPFGFYTPSYYE